ncbi:MAG TPA: hypothetical protein VF021_06575 [Longimicrobiales bacterium]
MNKDTVLLAGLAIVTVGMAILIIGVISPALFYPGVYLIAAGMLVTAIAGVLHIMGSERV